MLSPSQISAVHRALGTGRYEVRLLANPNGQAVVLVGEVHVKKTVEEAEAGRELRRQFPWCASESMRPELLWGHALRFLRLGEYLHDRHRAWVQSRGRGTTIDERPPRLPIDRENTGALGNDFLRELSERMKRGENVDHLIRDAVKTFVREEVVPQLGREIDLEKDHPPTLGEQLYSVYDPLRNGIAFGGCLMVLGRRVISSFAPSIGEFVTSHSGAILAGAVIATGLGFLDMLGVYLIKRFRIEGRWADVLSPGSIHVRSRDKTMARNTAAALEQYPSVPTLISLVGMGHVPGMTKRLVRDHGFREQPLPSKNEVT